MNSLEFIEKEIIICNNNIDFQTQLAFEKQEFKLAKRYHENEALKLTERLQTLQQIKSELEAWEVVQGTIVEGEDGDGNYCYIETVYFTGEKGEKVKKGLYNDETR